MFEILQSMHGDEQPMTDLSRLKVSLTKHGAHKVARLLKVLPPDDVLDNTWDSIEDIKIDRAQASKNLSANRDGSVPDIWHDVKKLDGGAVDRLVFLAIAFSHHEILKVMRIGATGIAKGKIEHDGFANNKSFTNFKNDLIELGLSTNAGPSHVVYDLISIFDDTRLPPLAAKLFTIKLKQARWDQKVDLIDECVAQGFHEALAVSEDYFRKWLSGSIAPRDEANIETTAEDDQTETIKKFRFTAGHTSRKTGHISRRSANPSGLSELRHNKLQTEIYNFLSGKYGPENVGTEVPSGVGGTSIDIVLKENDGCVFYELKTDGSLRSCIRAAIPQLLEYAYWPNKVRAKSLVIVAEHKPTEEAKQYLRHLREQFEMPITYQQFDQVKGEFGKPI